jgi:asparagine synthase (glutamine-hydrolysing)
MCGICGIFDLAGHPIARHDLNRMIARIRHRGPDGEGNFIENEVGLAHRRLSIIDINGGAQPIANEDKSVHVVFNGEIYNFIELRKQLEVYGHIFATRSDTEIIVHAYEQWGENFLNRLNGMFAFALWDARRKQMLLARDHLGIKPLYYVQIGSRILFGSEIKSLICDPECPRSVNTAALAELFTFRYVPGPSTLFQGIHKLLPGHFMTCNRSGTHIKRYWTWVPGKPSIYSEEDAIAKYQELLEDAVRLQLRSDVPLGLFLSSGVDSGALLAIMSQHCQGPVQAFTIGFEDGGKTNEVEDAAKVATMFGARHRYTTVTARDYCNYYERYMRDLEEPVGHESAAAFYFVAHLARNHVKVAFCGQGVDEPWAGYNRHVGIQLSASYSTLPASITRSVARIISHIPGRMEKLKRAAYSLGEPDVLTRLTKVYSFFSADVKAQLYKGSLKSMFESDPYGARHALARLQNNVGDLDPLTQMMYMDTRANLPDDLLMVGDKTSMANSLEARVPYLDYRLIEFVESLPPRLKLRGLTGKYLHKKALLKWLPRRIVYQRKKGFSLPIAQWLRTTMRPMVEDCLLSSDSAVASYFDQAYIRKMLLLDRNGIEHYTRHINLLMSFELWYRTFIREQQVTLFR